MERIYYIQLVPVAWMRNCFECDGRYSMHLPLLTLNLSHWNLGHCKFWVYLIIVADVGFDVTLSMCTGYALEGVGELKL